jgi:hypothetical protein
MSLGFSSNHSNKHGCCMVTDSQAFVLKLFLSIHKDDFHRRMYVEMSVRSTMAENSVE